MHPLRAIKELFDPLAKCLRAGHEFRPARHVYFEYPSKDGGVADEVVYRVKRCLRCGVECEMVEVDRDALHGLTMPGDDWRRLKRVGRLKVSR